MRMRLVAATLLAAAALSLWAPTTFAECFPFADSATKRLDVSYAFVATVTESSRDVDLPDGDYSTFDWHVEFDVERTYLGKLPKTIAYNGWDVGCHELRADHLNAGDKVFILVEGFHPEYTPRDPFDGDVVLWKATQNGWRFQPDVLAYSAQTKVYTPAVRDAATTAAILRVVSSVNAPPTDTVEPTLLPPAETLRPEAVAFLTAFFLGLVYLIRRDAKAGAHVTFSDAD